MGIEVNSTTAICSKCGSAYGRRKGYFSVNYGELSKGIGYLPVCKKCVDTMYNSYLSQCGSARAAVRQMCRKLDLYWNDKVFDAVEKKNTVRTMMTGYIAKINTVSYAGKSYDDTLSEEGSLWSFDSKDSKEKSVGGSGLSINEVSKVETTPIDKDIIEFWGPGLDDEMYSALEQRRSLWMSKFPQDTPIDIGTEAIIRQICSLELDINRDRAAGRPVDKSINALNTLLGSASLKPAQKKGDDQDSSVERTPMGVWIQKLEFERPIKDIDPELEDVDGIKKYITVWFFGHLCKMLNIKNSYCKLYEEEIEKMRVDHPEYDDEDDDTMLTDLFSGSEDGIP